MITEPIRQLEPELADIDAAELALGFSSIFEALSFLHTKVSDLAFSRNHIFACYHA